MRYLNPLEKTCEEYDSNTDFNGALGQSLANASQNKYETQEFENEVDFGYAHDFLKDAKALHEGGNTFYETSKKANLLLKYHPDLQKTNGKDGERQTMKWCINNNPAKVGQVFNQHYQKAAKTIARLGKK